VCVNSSHSVYFHLDRGQGAIPFVQEEKAILMFKCQLCGGAQSAIELVDEVFNIDDQFLLVEEIPAEVCLTCGDPTYSHETTEKIRRLVKGGVRPVRSINIPVYSFG
jgi:HTH-type transcriptional regulator / antitoxin MqsA